MKIQLIAISSTFGSTIERARNPECDVINGADACDADCQTAQVDCIVACGGDAGCSSGCSRDFITCQDACPCYGSCFDGCPCTESDPKYCEMDDVSKDIELLIFEPSQPDHEGMNLRFTWPIGENGSVDAKQYTIRDASINLPYEFNMDRRGMCQFMYKGTYMGVHGKPRSSRRVWNEQLNPDSKI